MKLRLIAIALLLGSNLFARIGESLDECKLRYGSAGQVAPDEYKFNRGHVAIFVHIRNGRSIQEDYAPESGDSFTQSDFDELLAENSEGSTWDITGETSGSVTLFRKDGKASAQKAKPNTSGAGNVKLTIKGAELIIKYTAEAASKLPPAP